MLFIWLASAILAISVIGIVVVLVRKLPLAAAVDPRQSMPTATRKAEIVETRLRRKFATAWSVLSERARPMAGSIGSVVGKTQAKLRDLEHEYKVRSLPVLLNRHQRHRLNDEIQTVLDQAEACQVEGEQKAAEEKCLQAIRMEPRSIPAFEMLGDLYFQTKEYAHAKEVYRYLEKLTEEEDAIYDHHSDEANVLAREQRPTMQVRYQERLAELFQALDDQAAAFESIQAAYRLAPTNPKVLDRYLDIAIALGRKAFAASALDQLRQVNPENTKIADWAEAIAALPETHLADAEMVDIDPDKAIQ